VTDLFNAGNADTGGNFRRVAQLFLRCNCPSRKLCALVLTYPGYTLEPAIITDRTESRLGTTSPETPTSLLCPRYQRCVKCCRCYRRVGSYAIPERRRWKTLIRRASKQHLGRRIRLLLLTPLVRALFSLASCHCSLRFSQGVQCEAVRWMPFPIRVPQQLGATSDDWVWQHVIFGTRRRLHWPRSPLPLHRRRRQLRVHRPPPFPQTTPPSDNGWCCGDLCVP
jgi:hypothetical protein